MTLLMNKTYRCNRIFPLLLLLTCPLVGRGSDLRPDESWGAVVINQELPRGLDLTFTNEIRFKDHSTHFRKSVSEVELSYKLNKYLDLGVEYRFFTTTKKSGERSGLGAKVSVDTGPLEHSYRLKAQREWTRTDGSEAFLRHKYQLSFENLNRLTPYFAMEAYTSLAFSNPNLIKTRSILGLSAKISKQHEIKVYYMLQDDKLDEESERILGFEVEFELDWKDPKKP